MTGNEPRSIEGTAAMTADGGSQGDGRSIAMGDPEETTTWERARERGITDEQWTRFEDAVAEMFGAFGMDLHTEATGSHTSSVRPGASSRPRPATQEIPSC